MNNALFVVTCVICSIGLGVVYGRPGGPPLAADQANLANRYLSVTFDRQTGALVSLRNLHTGDEYLKEPDRIGNPFLIHVDPTIVPRAARDPGWWSAEVEDDLGGVVVAPASCRVISVRERPNRSGKTLTLTSEHAQTGLRMVMTVTVPASSAYADLTLQVTNVGNRRRTVVTAFPHVNGLSLGSDRETNLGIMMASYGTPGVKAWTNSGGWYGRETSMQWQAAYEPRLDEGVGMVVMDPDCAPKLIRRGPGGLLSTLHYPGAAIEPGGTRVYPTARLVVHRGSWRITAQVYRDWFGRAFRIRRPPSWLKQVDLYHGGWIPAAEDVAKAKAQARPVGFTSFERMPLLYKDGPYDLIEWAMYNQGVVDEPASYGPYMGDGTYLFRSDLGGPAAMREGVSRLHAMGRRIMFYVAGNSILRSSAVLRGSKPEDWMLMDRPGHGYDIGYPNGFSVCPGYKPWQDQLARTARRILAESGADGIRLDEMAGFVRCFNPAHRHASPFDSVRWQRELTRKVRAAMDEVNPDAILLTENPLDAVHESVNGALQMFQPGREVDAMRVAVPSLIGMAYHPGAVESALNGWIGGKVTARRVTWPWEHRGLPGKPDWYEDGPGPELRWHELRATFADALSGSPEAVDPAAGAIPSPLTGEGKGGGERWVGRLWRAKSFLVMIGGTLDGSKPASPIVVRIPGVPASVGRALEIDAETLEVREMPRSAASSGSTELTVTGRLSAVLLPLPSCPPLVVTAAPASVRVGGQASIGLRAIRTGVPIRAGLTVQAACPGLISGTVRCAVPGALTFRVPPSAAPGLYPLRITGDILPVKRWIRVVE